MTNVISAVIAAIVGAICSGWIAWMVTKGNTEQAIKGSFDLINLQERNKAAATFRAAFIEVIMILNDGLRQRDLPLGYVPDIIKSSIKGHTKAYIKLSPYLSSEDLATKDIKHTFITVPFEKDWKEYELNYQKHVSIAAEPARENHEIKLEDFLKYLEMDCLKTGMTKEECDRLIDEWVKKLRPLGSSFKPLNDNPASLIDAIQDYIVNIDSENEFFDKALGA